MKCTKGKWLATEVSPCEDPASKQQVQQLSDTIEGNDEGSLFRSLCTLFYKSSYRP